MEMDIQRRRRCVVGYAFVKDQKIEKVYQPKKALAEGTIFPELNLKIGEYERGFNCDE